jgi:uncharacterized damage-inducible protein DinB
MAASQDELLQHYRSMREELLSAIAGLSENQLTEPTLDGWAVKDHLVHIALWDEIRASEVERISAGWDSLWKLDQQQETAFSSLFYEIRRSASAAQALWELRETHARFMNVLGAVTARGLEPSLYGEAGLFSRHEAAHTTWIQRWRGERGF